MIDVLGRPESRLPILTLPGASPKARFDVTIAMTTVEIRLLLNGSD